jgi:hypothetical protein
LVENHDRTNCGSGVGFSGFQFSFRESQHPSKKSRVGVSYGLKR